LTVNSGFLEYLSDGVLVLDTRLVIRAVNPALETLLGFKADEMLGQTCRELFNCQHSPQATRECRALCPLVSPADPHRPAELSTSLTVKNGRRLDITARYAPLALPDFELNPAGDFSLLILKDLTAEKYRERLQVEFLATASHQLRTPLAAIKTAVGLLLDQTVTDFNPLLRRLIQNIQVSSLRLERVVNDLIELTNLQSGRVSLNFRSVEVARLVERAAELSRDLLAARQQRLQLDLPSNIGALFIEADYNRICQVLGHLLGNASKFSPPGSLIELKVRQGEGQTVVFSVRDEGKGIPPDEQPFIFERFYQVQSVENSQEGGSGLGLPLARVLVELNGGRLWFESQPGRGSTFYFSLPTGVPFNLAGENGLDRELK
jgi:signal transduction histidine kinase